MRSPEGEWENGRQKGRGQGEAGRGRREANTLNFYEKCPTLKHLSQRGGRGRGRQREERSEQSMKNVQH